MRTKIAFFVNKVKRGGRLFRAFLPAAFGRLFGAFLPIGGRHRFEAALAADLAALAAHFGHHPGESVMVYRGFFCGRECYNCGCDLARVFELLANSLWHTASLSDGEAGRKLA